MTYEDFKTYLPEYEFDEKQIEFFKDTFQLITTNRDTSKVTCIAARCGVGKSTFIKAFMYACIGNKYFYGRHEPTGVIVITDSIKRLEELSNNEKDKKAAKESWGELFSDWGIKDIYDEFEKSVIVLKSDMPFMEQLINQHYKPIVLLSTQRYFMLSEKVREQLFSFSYKNKLLKRNVIIFDECPYFSETISINSKNLTDIESALYEGLSNEVEVKDKEFVIKEYKHFKDRLLDLMDVKEKISEDSNVVVYWKDERHPTITKNDELFFDVILENIESLSKKYNAILKDLRCLQKLAREGAIFNSVKKKYGNYERSFIMVIDNKDSFYLGQDRKFFVFDATADIDPRYDLDYVELIKCPQYNNPLNMTISNVKISTSKNVLCNGTKKSFSTTKAISNYLLTKKKTEFGHQKDIFVVIYSDLYRRFIKDFQYVGYFGNLKGFNSYKDLSRMAHIGMNRFPNLAYFYLYCGCHMHVYNQLSNMSEKESLQFFDSLSKNHNKEYQHTITNIMLRCMLADFEQNIFRLAIRNYDNSTHVHIWTFYNNDDELYKCLSSMIENRFGKYDTKFEYEDTPESLLIDKVKDRKPPDGKEMTNAQKILEWYDNQPNGKIFKLSEMLSELSITNKQFDKTKAKNKYIKELFEKNSTGKRGFYKIA